MSMGHDNSVANDPFKMCVGTILSTNTAIQINGDSTVNMDYGLTINDTFPLVISEDAFSATISGTGMFFIEGGSWTEFSKTVKATGYYTGASAGLGSAGTPTVVGFYDGSFVYHTLTFAGGLLIGAT